MFAFGEKAIYASYLSQNFTAISYEGQTLRQIQYLEPDGYWNEAVSTAWTDISVDGNQATVTVHDNAEDRQFVYYVDLDTYAVTSSPENEEQMSQEWKDAYIEYIDEYTQQGYTSELDTDFYLLNINNDNIPELYMTGPNRIDGDRLSTYANGAVVERRTNIGELKYIPGENLLNDELKGYWGRYYDTIIQIKDGQFTEIGGGYYEEDFYNPQPETNVYYWNEEQVTEEEYFANLNAIYDKSREVSPSNAYSLSQIKEAIQNY